MLVRPGLVKVERLRVPHAPSRGVVSHVNQVVTIVVDVACTQRGGGGRKKGDKKEGEENIQLFVLEDLLVKLGLLLPIVRMWVRYSNTPHVTLRAIQFPWLHATHYIE